MTTRSILTLVAIPFTFVACTHEQSAPATSEPTPAAGAYEQRAATPESPPGSETKVETITVYTLEDEPIADAQVLDILSKANEKAIAESKIALSRSEDKDVQAFAREQIEDYGKLSARLGELQTALGITPMESRTGARIAREATTNVRVLSEHHPRSVAPAFTDLVRVDHNQVLDLLRRLPPAVTRTELRSFLDDEVLPMWQRHGDRARAIMAARTEKSTP